jgi:hypothetical protein
VKQTYIMAAVAVVLANMPVQAQPVAADLLPAYEVNTIVASMGMRPIGRPAWMRGRYVVAAIDRYGRDVNVVLDARDGQVLAVRPLGRGGFGPPPGYAGPPVPYDRMDERLSPPAPVPGGPPQNDEEFFDDDRQQGALPPRPLARTAPVTRDPSVTGSVTRSAPAQRKEAAPKDITPVPRPRPALARASDPGNMPASQAATQPVTAAKAEDAKPVTAPKSAQAEAKADVKADVKPTSKTPEFSKPQTRKLESSIPEASKSATRQASVPQPAAKPETAAKPEVRVIDLSKPKTAPKPDDKPGEAIRF